MFEELRQELETDALVRFKNGKSVYGIILDFIGKDGEVDNLRFVPNQFLELYRATENTKCVVWLHSDSVNAIDLCLK